MSTDHPFRVADAAAADKLDPITLEALVKRTVIALGPTESLGDIVQSTGEIALAVAAGALGQLFFYDGTDTTTPDDGQTCLVDGSGHRYHLEDQATIHVSSVLGETNTPAVGPTIGDAYIVGTSPTGVWAAHAKDVAIYTRRGWVYATPLVGMTVLNRATDQNRQFLDTGLWGAFAASPSAILPSAMTFPMGIAVEAVQNTPPVSPTTGLYYIVGPSPTGAWVGHANALVTYEGGTWVFTAAYEGAEVYDRTNNYMLIYDGGWTGSSGSIFQEFTSTAGGTWNKPAAGSVAFVQVWGAGGSGGRAGSGDGGGGGGGGSYAEYLFKLSDLTSTVAVTIGAGGASRTSNDDNGLAGGNSSFGAYLTAYGGGGGRGNTTDAGGGGGGAGQGAVGSVGTATVGGAGGADGSGQSGGAAGADSGGAGGDSQFGGAGGGGRGGVGGRSVFGGGGGGGGNFSSAGAAGGASHYGGGGGGGGSDGSGSSGGTSRLGGNGGAGGSGSGAAGSGVQPAGGGGGSSTGNSGKGGDGMVRVTVW